MAPVAGSALVTTAHSRAAGCRVRACSTSLGSTRKPPTLHLGVDAPQALDRAVRRRRAISPVRYSPPPGATGSAGNRSAVSSGLVARVAGKRQPSPAMHAACRARRRGRAPLLSRMWIRVLSMGCPMVTRRPASTSGDRGPHSGLGGVRTWLHTSPPSPRVSARRATRTAPRRRTAHAGLHVGPAPRAAASSTSRGSPQISRWPHARDQRGEPLAGARGRGVAEVALGAGDQRQKELQGGDVEAVRRHGEDPVGRAEPGRFAIAHRKLVSARWGTTTPLGRPVLPEGVDDVRGILGAGSRALARLFGRRVSAGVVEHEQPLAGPVEVRRTVRAARCG